MSPTFNFFEKAEKESANKPQISSADASLNGQTITIQNVRIDFPVKPYAAQIQMMNNIVNVLNKGENALLESPTGSGKSLSLLCAVLAWREKQEQIVAAEIKNKKLQQVQQLKQQPQPQPQPVIRKKVTTRVQVAQDDLDDDFQQPRAKRFIGELIETHVDKQEQIVEKDPELATLDEVRALKYDTYKEVPRIFVGSRTHKQIAQLVSELKNKTRYRPRTTVLGSRDHLCIHPKVKESFKKTEDCTELLEKEKCSYGKRTNAILTHSSLKTTNRVWDIEDMINLGKVTKGCPYYAARKLYEGAEVIFCPYNYIIDPIIRKILDINLKESIIIIDEAHNIEDASRSAGSFEIDENSMDSLLKELGAVVKYGGEPDAHKKLEIVVEQLFDFMTSPNTSYTSKEYEKQACHFTGSSILNKLKDINFTKNTFEEELLPAYKKASAHADLIRKELEGQVLEKDHPIDLDNDHGVRVKKVRCLSNGSLTILQGLFMVLGFLFDPENDYTNDYQMVLIKTMDRQGGAGANKRRKTANQQVSRSLWTHKLAFWCLNPGVIFKSMCKTTHSVILASGTLSPLNTFASELDTVFTSRLEANHVIKPDQVWVKAIPFGPNRIALRGIYNNIESFQYQDEVGESLCQIIETIPFGVLCFMPSYKALDLMLQRWKSTGIMERIERKKLVFSEPRGKDKNDFENMLNSFYEKIRSVECGIDEQGQDGALWFAVFRGKVSEGIDFPDNNCRAVITLGIPYPGFKDLEITLKREYNNRLKSQSKGRDVLSGSEWYSAQAYRAINQALGRCIRHKNDWGAIILLEERFTQQENANGLSKWVKARLKVEASYPDAMASLKSFVETQTKETEKLKLEQATSTTDLNQIETIDLVEPFKRETTTNSENQLPEIINLDDSVELIHTDEDNFSQTKEPLKSIENEIFVKPLPVQPKKSKTLSPGISSHNSLPVFEDNASMPSDYTQVTCKRCQHELFRGPVQYIKPKLLQDLISVAMETIEPFIMQLEHPEIWETSNTLLGGPLDIRALPVTSDVVFNNVDDVCYRRLSCQCRPSTTIGVVVCLASLEKQRHHVGNVYLFQERIDRVLRPTSLPHISQEDVVNEIPNSQYSSSDDIFFNL